MSFRRLGPRLILSFLALNAVGIGCGTQVGNGRSKPILTADNNGKGDKADTDPNAGTGNTTNDGTTTSSGTTQTTSTPDVTHLLIACGSPLAEITSGAFKDENDAQLVITSISATSNHLVLGPIVGDYTHGTTGTGNYQITLTPSTLAESFTCTSVTSMSAAGGGNRRTAIYSDGFETIWDVDATGKVTAIQVLSSTGAIQKTWTLQP